MLSVTAIIVVVAGAIAGSFVSGLAGFGTGLVALGFWLHVVDPAPAATLVAVCSVVAQAQTLPTVWHAVDGARIWPIVVAGIAGVPAGTMLLSSLDPQVFRLCVGVLLIGFSAFMLLGRVEAHITWGGRPADAAMGFAGGVLAGFTGLSGVFPIIWATLRGWGKDARRGVFQVFNLVILAAVVVWHVASGLVTGELVRLILVALPGTFFGAWCGARVYRRLSDRRFHVVVLCLLGLSGITLILASH